MHSWVVCVKQKGRKMNIEIIARDTSRVVEPPHLKKKTRSPHFNNFLS